MNDTYTEAPATYAVPGFAAQANGTAALANAEADGDQLGFWAKRRKVVVGAPFTDILDWSDAPVAAVVRRQPASVAYNCVDRHVEAGNGDQWRSGGGQVVGDSRGITYAGCWPRCRGRRTR
jgi:acetyl-CoA synthetase